VARKQEFPFGSDLHESMGWYPIASYTLPNQGPVPVNSGLSVKVHNSTCTNKYGDMAEKINTSDDVERTFHFNFGR